MRRTEIDGEAGNALAGVPASPTSARSAEAETVIPFRRASPRGPAADDMPPLSSAPFTSLGSATLAVVMRLGEKQFSVKSQKFRATGEEDDGPEQ